MNKIDVSKRSIGVNYKNGRASISVWAPNAQKVTLHIDGSNKREALKPKEHGYWHGTYRLQPGDQYTFMLDDKELPDPASLSQPEGVHCPSEIIDLSAYKWTDQQWVNPVLDNYIIYELHTGTFTSEGTFAAIEEKIDYLLDCGFTAIEILKRLR